MYSYEQAMQYYRALYICMACRSRRGFRKCLKRVIATLIEKALDCAPEWTHNATCLPSIFRVHWLTESIITLVSFRLIQPRLLARASIFPPCPTPLSFYPNIRNMSSAKLANPSVGDDVKVVEATRENVLVDHSPRMQLGEGILYRESDRTLHCTPMFARAEA